jgi:hypothetical protein
MMVFNIMARMAVLLIATTSFTTTHAYNLVREHSGQSFFDRWEFYGNWDNLTLGASFLSSILRLAHYGS